MDWDRRGGAAKGMLRKPRRPYHIGCSGCIMALAGRLLPSDLPRATVPVLRGSVRDVELSAILLVA